MEYIVSFFESFLEIFISMSFYIMLGLFFVGILHTYIKKEKVLKHLGSDKFSSVVKASMVGVPLPLCSCGVVPTALELKKDGASNGAVISFLVSTPQTGVDSIMATYSMMGPIMAVFRPLAAFASGIIGGAVVNIFAKGETIAVDTPIASCCCEGPAAEPAPVAESSCCCSGETEPVAESSCCCSGETEPVAESSCCCSGETEPVAESSCCCSGETEPETTCGCSAPELVSACGCSTPAPVSSCGCSAPEPVSACGCSAPAPVSACGCSAPAPVSACGCSSGAVEDKSLKSALRYAFCEFLDEISGHFFVGMVLASLISAFVPADFFISMGINQGILAMLSMVLVGLPMYICSTASIPIALSLITKGLSLGGAFVFLFTGPVTNIASLLVLRKVLGQKITCLYFALVVGCSIMFGLLLDMMVASSVELTALCESHMSHGSHVSPFSMVIAVVFALLLCASFYRNFKAKQAMS